jgi:hypothetical protein
MQTHDRVIVDREPEEPRGSRWLAVAAAIAVVIGAVWLVRALADDAVVADGVSTTAIEIGATTTAAFTATTVAPDAAPPELEGVWKVDIGQGITDRVTFRGNRYSWNFGASGDISVNGDVIEFSNAAHQLECPGRGSYRWLVEGDILTFTILESPDDCSIRQGTFVDREFYR